MRSFPAESDAVILGVFAIGVSRLPHLRSGQGRSWPRRNHPCVAAVGSHGAGTGPARDFRQSKLCAGDCRYYSWTYSAHRLRLIRSRPRPSPRLMCNVNQSAYECTAPQPAVGSGRLRVSCGCSAFAVQFDAGAPCVTYPLLDQSPCICRYLSMVALGGIFLAPARQQNGPPQFNATQDVTSKSGGEFGHLLSNGA
jgi:hypothetical protein